MATKRPKPKPKAKPKAVEVYAPDDPSPDQRAAAEALAAHGFSAADIGIYLEKPEDWVHTHFRDVMQRARVKFNVRLVQTITEVAFGREKQVRAVTKTRINAKGQEVEYQGQEIVREGRPPNPGMLMYLAKDRLGWADPESSKKSPLHNIAADELQYERLTDSELDQLGRLLQKAGAEPPAGESS